MADRTSPLKGVAHFSSDAQILSELGERLIASPVVALAELVKNAYDADATETNLWLDRADGTLNLRDNGQGMTVEDFLKCWMVIGTTSKLRRAESPLFRRALTGAKGVGRFAARMLGETLDLVTVARDSSTGEYSRLTAQFKWQDFRKGGDLLRLSVPYEVRPGATSAERGTLLQIGRLSRKWDNDSLQDVTGDLLDVIEPPLPLAAGQLRGTVGKDPGFHLRIGPPGSSAETAPAGKELLDRWTGKVSLSVDGKEVKWTVEIAGRGQKPRVWNHTLEENLVGQVTSEIRYFPRRAGVFSQMETMDGRRAARFLKDRGGVRVVDRGFRVLPYGDPGDDWLGLSRSAARNQRYWESEITERYFPRSSLPRSTPEDPTLRLPANHQLLGTVCVASTRSLDKPGEGHRNKSLEPAMDRSGFVRNEGLVQLTELVRTGLEFLAVLDTQHTLRQKTEAAAKAARGVSDRIDSAIDRVQASREISPAEKQALVQSYRDLKESFSLSAEASREALRSIESISLLGVLAGFMTHETTVMQRSTEEMLQAMKNIPRDSRPRGFDGALRRVETAHSQLAQYIEYAKMFLTRVHDREVSPYPARPQIQLVLDNFGRFIDETRLDCRNEVGPKVMAPPVSVAVYTAIVMNLFTNAAKAIIGLKDGQKPRVITFSTESAGGVHILRVCDTGVGVPEELRDLIFLPTFRSSPVEGPLGTGMGLGLSIVKRVVENLGGSIKVGDAPPDFSTCFEVRFRGG